MWPVIAAPVLHTFQHCTHFSDRTTFPWQMGTRKPDWIVTRTQKTYASLKPDTRSHQKLTWRKFRFHSQVFFLISHFQNIFEIILIYNGSISWKVLNFPGSCEYQGTFILHRSYQSLSQKRTKKQNILPLNQNCTIFTFLLINSFLQVFVKYCWNINEFIVHFYWLHQRIHFV